MAPRITLSVRVSIDSAGHQRFSEEEILYEFKNENVELVRNILCRKTDGAILGEILTNDIKTA